MQAELEQVHESSSEAIEQAAIGVAQAITARAAEIMLSQGFTPPLIVRGNTPAGTLQICEITENYRHRLIRYKVPTVDQPNK